MKIKILFLIFAIAISLVLAKPGLFSGEDFGFSNSREFFDNSGERFYPRFPGNYYQPFRAFPFSNSG